MEGVVWRWVDFRVVCLLMGWSWKPRKGVGGGGVICLCFSLEKELTSSAEETRGANVKI